MIHAVVIPVLAGIRLDHEKGNIWKYRRTAVDKRLHADRPRFADHTVLISESGEDLQQLTTRV